MKDSAWRDALAPLCACAALFLVAAAVRPIIPVDETRYASVAWEMHLRGDWLVPHLNGIPYSHKPPLLFWLILCGWSVLGVSELWFRAVPALCTLANVYLVARLARRLWPDDRACARLAPWIFAAAGLPALFGTVVFFDPLLTTVTIVALDALVRAAGGSRGWLWLYGAALGLGVLAKGPVVFVHALPAALLAPWWARDRLSGRRGSWYAGVGRSALLGAGLALAWALPAARAGGRAYHDELLWGQTADRMVKSFAHRRPFWFYVPQLLLALAPWSLWPPFVRTLASLRRGPGDSGIRLCAAWFLPGIVVLSLVSGKQPQYMLPLLPAVALAAARALGTRADAARATRASRIPVVTALAIVGAILIAASLGALAGRAPEWTSQIPWWGGAAVLGCAAALLYPQARAVEREVSRLALAFIFTLVVLHVAAVPHVLETHDIRTVARLLERLESEGHPVAHAGTYHGQYQFLGRLTRPLIVIDRGEAAEWARAHPDGSVVVYFDSWKREGAPAPTLVQPYRGKFVTVWPAAAIVAAGDSLGLDGDEDVRE